MDAGVPGYQRHRETSVLVAASAQALFDHVDDHARLSSHMSQSSWMMGGGKMTLDTDAGGGKCVGSRLRLAGRIFGVALSVQETVTERIPPRRKVWETEGEPRLLVIGRYRMGFEIVPEQSSSRLMVFIDYDLPAAMRMGRLGAFLADYYAAWCTRRMAEDAARHFNRAA